jgi:hypothetical protein
MSKPNDAIDLTVVYEDAGAGRLTASIPALPGTISWGPTGRKPAARSLMRSARCFRSSPKTSRTTQRPSACASQWPPHGVRRAICDSTASSGTGRTRSSHGSIRP